LIASIFAKTDVSKLSEMNLMNMHMHMNMNMNIGKKQSSNTINDELMATCICWFVSGYFVKIVPYTRRKNSLAA